MTELPIQQLLLDTVAVIERLGFRYAIMGGFAARVWGLPRPTFDVDIAVAVDAEQLQRLFDALERAGFDIPKEHRTGFLDVIAGFSKAKATRFVDRHVWHIDLFVAEGDFLTRALARAQAATIGQRQVRVMSAEDIILLKLIAHRRKDLADIEDILALCSDLDRAYLRDWAGRLGVADRLAAFLSDAS